MSHLDTIDRVAAHDSSRDRRSDGVVGGARPTARMGQIMRTWLGFAALGAGMIHLALVISSPPPIAVALVVLGVAEFGWGVLTFARDELLVPRAARAVAVAPIILWSLLVVTATLLGAPDIAGSLTLLPMAIATTFGVFVAAMLGRHIRRLDAAAETGQYSADGTERAASDTSPATPSAGRYLSALMVGGLVVAFLTTPALAGTEAGRFAQPHGEHDSDFVPTPVDDDPLDGFVLPDHEVH